MKSTNGVVFSISLLALLFSGYVAFRKDAAVLPVSTEISTEQQLDEEMRSVEETPTLSDTSVLEERITNLEATVRMLKAPFSGIENRLDNLETAIQKDKKITVSKERAQSLRYVQILSPDPSVYVEQDSDGSIRVQNADPTLAGKMLIMQAIREDDSIEPIPVVVPESQ